MLTTKESEALIAAIRLLKPGAVRRCRSRWNPPREDAGDPAGGASAPCGADSPVCPDFGAHRYAKTHFDVIHQAVSGQQVLQLRYQDETGRVTERDVLPLGLFFWGERWLLVALVRAAQ